jgi:ribonuclease H / adenosylcobalamin/alpha-ribazole phosphatase
MGRWQGRADPPLTDFGRAQAAMAALRLNGVEAVFSSPLARAHETARIMAQAIGLAPAVEVVDGLIERDCGEWTGLTVAEIDERWPGDLAAWRTPAGFEPDEQVSERVSEELRAIGRRHPGGTVAAVAHGGLMRVMRRALGGADEPIKNLDARWIEIRGDDLALGEEAVLLADPASMTTATEEQA